MNPEHPYRNEPPPPEAPGRDEMVSCSAAAKRPACTAFLRRLHEELDAQRRPGLADDLIEHAQICPEHRRELSAAGAMLDAIEALPPVELPASVRERALGRLRESAPSLAPSMPLARRWWPPRAASTWASLTACAVVMVGVAVYFTANAWQGDEPAPLAGAPSDSEGKSLAGGSEIAAQPPGADSADPDADEARRLAEVVERFREYYEGWPAGAAQSESLVAAPGHWITSLTEMPSVTAPAPLRPLGRSVMGAMNVIRGVMEPPADAENETETPQAHRGALGTFV